MVSKRFIINNRLQYGSELYNIIYRYYFYSIITNVKGAGNVKKHM